MAHGLRQRPEIEGHLIGPLLERGRDRASGGASFDRLAGRAIEFDRGDQQRRGMGGVAALIGIVEMGDDVVAKGSVEVTA